MEEFENSVNLVVASLRSKNSILINVQVPDEMSQFDIFFSYDFNNVGIHQRGIVSSDLIIGVIGLGCFGFRIDIFESSEGYYAEKLGIRSEALTLFFNEVRRRLHDLQSI